MEKKFREIRWNNLWGSLILALGLLFVMGLVPVLFQNFDKQIAGLMASSLFLFISAACVHAAQEAPKHVPLLIASVVFLFGFAVPIVVFRLAFWGQDFASIQVGIISGKALHSTSSLVYFVMFGASLHRLWTFYKNK